MWGASALVAAACTGGISGLQLMGASGRGGDGDAVTRAGTRPVGSTDVPTVGATPAAASAASAAGPAAVNASPTVGPTGGPSRCPAAAPAGTLCDGFEGPAPGAAPSAGLWQVEVQNADSQVVVDSSRAARGGQSLHVHTGNAGYERAVILASDIFPAPGNAFFGRAFIYLAGTVPKAHFTLVAAAGPAAQVPATWLRYGGQYGAWMANFAGDDSSQHSGTSTDGGRLEVACVPHDRWVCIEWQFKGSSNEMHFWQDGAAIDTLSVVGSPKEAPGSRWVAPTFGRLQLGWEMYASEAGAQGFDLWIDEVALGPARIGCLN